MINCHFHKETGGMSSLGHTSEARAYINEVVQFVPRWWVMMHHTGETGGPDVRFRKLSNQLSIQKGIRFMAIFQKSSVDKGNTVGFSHQNMLSMGYVEDLHLAKKVYGSAISDTTKVHGEERPSHA